MSLQQLITDYLRRFPSEEHHLRQLTELLKHGSGDESLTARSNFVGHITASAIVIYPREGKVLRILNQRLNIPLQPGGHLAKSESPLSAAIRYLQTTIPNLEVEYVPYHYHPDVPIDIDTHEIPEDTTVKESEHYHHDFRYLFITETSGGIHGADVPNSPPPRWDDINELNRLETFSRLCSKIQEVLGPRFRPKRFYDRLVSTFNISGGADAIAVSHILPDAPPYLRTLDRLTKNFHVIAKPKSLDRSVCEDLSKDISIHKIHRPSPSNLQAIDEILNQCDAGTVLMDIGGWFAPIIETIVKRQPNKIRGIIEDTENGHQKYAEMEENSSLPVPVFSVARSPLKENEDFLIGQSILFSADSILRSCGSLFQYMTCSVLGYGKIGRSIAHHLLLRGIRPNIFDTNSIKRLASSNGLAAVPPREWIVGHSDVIFCATGNYALDIHDFRRLKQGCFVFTVTSSDDELNLAHVDAEYQSEEILPHVTRYYSFTNHFYLVNKGNAVNFIHGAVVGDFIHAVRAEIIVAYHILMGSDRPPGLLSVDDKSREQIASLWLDTIATDAFPKPYVVG